MAPDPRNRNRILTINPIPPMIAIPNSETRSNNQTSSREGLEDA
jgi:hypothetical protein